MVTSVGHHHRQDVAEDDAGWRGAHHLRRLHEHPLLDLEDLGAGGAQVDRDAGDREHEDDVRRPTAIEHVEHDHREEQRREAT